MLGEGPAQEVMNRETKHDHLEGFMRRLMGCHEATPGPAFEKNQKVRVEFAGGIGARLLLRLPHQSVFI